MTRSIPDNFLDFKQAHPDISKAFEELGRIVHESGPLTERERRLVKLGIAVGVNTEGAVHSAVRHALVGGCNAEEIEHVVHLAITTLGWPRAMAALSWVRDVTATRRPNRRRAAPAKASAAPTAARPRKTVRGR